MTQKLVEKFKAELWENTDQRILSYNRTAHSFPKIYTNSQFRKLITAFANAPSFVSKRSPSESLSSLPTG